MIYEKLKSAILDELKIGEYEITAETQANQIPGWDSLNHMNVILSIEKSYGIRFSAYDVLRCNNIGDLQNLIDRKINQKE